MALLLQGEQSWPQILVAESTAIPLRAQRTWEGPAFISVPVARQQVPVRGQSQLVLGGHCADADASGCDWGKHTVFVGRLQGPCGEAEGRAKMFREAVGRSSCPQE